MKTLDIKTKIKRTKIIATLGPASNDEKDLKKLFNLGVDTVRLNFSHGNYDEQGARIIATRKIVKETGKAISILLDTKGPEIRIGQMKNGKQTIQAGEKITIYTTTKKYESLVCGPNVLTVSYDMSIDLKSGDTVLVDDGKLQIKVTSVKSGIVEGTAFNRHIIKTNKRVNLPGVNFSLPFLSDKDIKDIIWGTKHHIDYIAASFVNNANNIKKIRSILAKENAEHIQIFAKIESQLGVKNIDEIINASDGIMIARGDLGLEIPYYDVPWVEKTIIRKCRDKGKIVIVATQMLETMTDNPHPTRAEVTDVYYATELGADATMLSGETAAGLYPSIVVNTMATINKRAEHEFYSKIYYSKYITDKLKIKTTNKREKIACKVVKKAQHGKYDFAIVYSTTGELLKSVSRLRPNTNIIGISHNEKLFTAFGSWHSITMAKTSDYEKMKENNLHAITVAKEFGAKKGDCIFVIRSSSLSEYKIK